MTPFTRLLQLSRDAWLAGLKLSELYDGAEGTTLTLLRVASIDELTVAAREQSAMQSLFALQCAYDGTEG